MKIDAQYQTHQNKYKFGKKIISTMTRWVNEKFRVFSWIYTFYFVDYKSFCFYFCISMNLFAMHFCFQFFNIFYNDVGSIYSKDESLTISETERERERKKSRKIGNSSHKDFLEYRNKNSRMSRISTQIQLKW